MELLQGYVGCLVDPELIQDKLAYSGGRNLYYSHDSPTHVSHVSSQVNVGHEALTTRTPDTSFYQWVPFVLVLQVCFLYHIFYVFEIFFQGSIILHSSENMEK